MGGIVSSSSFRYERLRTYAECDLVVVQGRYSATGVVFDMFRVKDDKIMEHWDSDTNQASAAFTLSEGTRDGAAYGLHDLFRVEGGDIVEHWDSRRAVPASTMSGLGIFWCDICNAKN